MEISGKLRCSFAIKFDGFWRALWQVYTTSFIGDSCFSKAWSLFDEFTIK